jgi:AAA+ superfamily predicted ATPase
MSHHSKVSADLIARLENTFEYLVGPLEKSLWECQNEGDKGTARQNVFWDVNSLICFVLRDTEIYTRVASLVADIWDYSDKVSDCHLELATHREDLKEYIKKNRMLNASPPTYVIWLLQQFDAKNGTQKTRSWVELISALSDCLMTEAEFSPAKREQLRETLQSTYGVEYFEKKSGQLSGSLKRLSSYWSPVGEEACQRIYSELQVVEPVLRSISNASPTLAGKCEQAGWLLNCVMTALPYIANLDPTVPPERLFLIRDICVVFGDYAESDDYSQWQQSYYAWLKTQQAQEVTLMLSVLKEYDDTVGGDLYVRTKNLLTWLAEKILLSGGGSISENGRAWLSGFKQHTPRLPDTLMGLRAKLISMKNNVQSEDDDADILENILDELNSLTGLDRVKQDMTQLINFIKVQQLRKSKGIATSPISMHLVFLGNPGTGKTTVARLVARVYKAMGILKKGHMVEADRSALVAGFVGQTALKVQDVVKSAKGGVLFIDEAYTLAGDGQDAFGREAIDTLLKLMEDHRDSLVVIVAGYSANMEKFLESNPGLKSRFNKYITFDDYTPDQLLKIFEFFSSKSGFTLSESGSQKLLQLFQTMYAGRDEKFGNGRDARNVFEKAITRQADRIVTLPNIDEKTLTELTDADIPEFSELSMAK